MKTFSKQFHTSLYLLKWLLIVILISSIIGSVSALFLITLEWVTAIRGNNLWIVSLLPIAGFFVGCLYHYFGKNIEGGNNLIIETILGKLQKIPFIMAPLVYVSTIITHLFGGSAGREGTALQMASAIADQFTSLFRLKQEDRQILLIASVAAGFGSVFGTPLAGCIFALEFYHLGKLKYNALIPAFLSAISADLVTKFWEAKHTHYVIPSVLDLDVKGFLLAILSGVVFGICAAIFVKGMKWLSVQFKHFIKYPPLRPFLGGIMLLLLIYLVGSTRYIGLGIPVILESFLHPLSFSDFSLKILFTLITLSCGFKGGEVTPLFFIGATLGSALSIFIPIPTALLAGMGFVAVFSGATNTPIASTIMGIELFGIDGGVFMAIACIVSYLVSGNSSIYSSQKISVSKIPALNLFKDPNNKN